MEQEREEGISYFCMHNEETLLKGQPIRQSVFSTATLPKALFYKSNQTSVCLSNGNHHALKDTIKDMQCCASMYVYRSVAVRYHRIANCTVISLY